MPRPPASAGSRAARFATDRAARRRECSDEDRDAAPVPRAQWLGPASPATSSDTARSGATARSQRLQSCVRLYSSVEGCLPFGRWQLCHTRRSVLSRLHCQYVRTDDSALPNSDLVRRLQALGRCGGPPVWCRLSSLDATNSDSCAGWFISRTPMRQASQILFEVQD